MLVASLGGGVSGGGMGGSRLGRWVVVLGRRGGVGRRCLRAAAEWGGCACEEWRSGEALRGRSDGMGRRCLGAVAESGEAVLGGMAEWEGGAW